MMTVAMPPPPKPARLQTVAEAGPQPVAFTPPTGSAQIADVRLSEEETLQILSTILRPSQMNDVVVIRFILAYVQNRSVAQSAREVGISTGQGHTLRQRPEIHAAIDALTMRSLMKYGYDDHEVIQRVKEIADLNLADLQNPDGSYKNSLHLLPEELQRAIKTLVVKNCFEKDLNGMEKVVGEIIRIEFYDKLKALELLGIEKDKFKKKSVVEHDVTKNMADVLLGSASRAEARALEGAREITGVVESSSMPPMPKP